MLFIYFSSRGCYHSLFPRHITSITLSSPTLYLNLMSLRSVITFLGPWRRQWHPTSVLLPGKSHGWRSLVGCSPWGRWESGMTEQLHFHFSLSCIGEGNGNPLQCSCLENPGDGKAWWAAVYGVTQSWTRLKWLSSSRQPKIWTQNWHSVISAISYLPKKVKRPTRTQREKKRTSSLDGRRGTHRQ